MTTISTVATILESTTIVTTTLTSNNATTFTNENQTSTRITSTALTEPNMTGAIVGGVIGGLLGAGLTIFLAIIFWRRRIPKASNTPGTSKQEQEQTSKPAGPARILSEANSTYDSVLPAAASTQNQVQQGGYYQDQRQNNRSSHHDMTDDDDPDALYVNTETSPYVNFSTRNNQPNYRGSNYQPEEDDHFYGNLPHPASRTPSTIRHEEEEDEYLPMDNFRPV